MAAEIFTLTEKAKVRMTELMLEENISSETHFLRVGVKGGGCSGLSYELGFDNLEKEAQQKGLNIEILVRGVGVLGNNLCLKGLKQNTDNMIETYEEYYEGSVRDASKFEDLYSSRITIFYK